MWLARKNSQSLFITQITDEDKYFLIGLKCSTNQRAMINYEFCLFSKMLHLICTYIHKQTHIVYFLITLLKKNPDQYLYYLIILGEFHINYIGYRYHGGMALCQSYSILRLVHYHWLEITQCIYVCKVPLIRYYWFIHHLNSGGCSFSPTF